MKAVRLWSIALCLLLLPGLARAAPEPISLADYETRLQRASEQIEAARKTATEGGSLGAIIDQVTRAREQLGSTWLVDTGKATVESDLRPVVVLLDKAVGAGAEQKQLIGAAADAVQEHLKAAQSLAGAEVVTLPDARRHLGEALKASEVKQSLLRRLIEWLARLLTGNPPSINAREPNVTPAADRPLLKWIAIAVGAIGLVVLTVSLMRRLQGQPGGGEAKGTRGRPARPNRPLTPDEMLEAAREYAAAGDYKEALRTAHLAVLQHYDRLALFRYDPALTDREHERVLRRKFPGLARGLHALNDLVETGLYSGHGVSPADFARGEQVVRELWREGDDASKSALAPTGASSPASSR